MRIVWILILIIILSILSGCEEYECVQYKKIEDVQCPQAFTKYVNCTIYYDNGTFIKKKIKRLNKRYYKGDQICHKWREIEK